MIGLLVLVLLLFAQPVYAGSFYLNDAAGLTGPFACDDQMQTASWTNQSGGTMRFTSALTWIGVLRKGVGDVWAFVSRASDGAPMTFMAWDHYAEPTGPHQFNEQFNPPFEVPHGDGLLIQYYCQASARSAQVIIKVQHQ